MPVPRTTRASQSYRGGPQGSQGRCRGGVMAAWRITTVVTVRDCKYDLSALNGVNNNFGRPLVPLSSYSRTTLKMGWSCQGEGIKMLFQPKWIMLPLVVLLYCLYPPLTNRSYLRQYVDYMGLWMRSWICFSPAVRSFHRPGGYHNPLYPDSES